MKLSIDGKILRIDGAAPVIAGYYPGPHMMCAVGFLDDGDRRRMLAAYADDGIRLCRFVTNCGMAIDGWAHPWQKTAGKFDLDRPNPGFANRLRRIAADLQAAGVVAVVALNEGAHVGRPFMGSGPAPFNPIGPGLSYFGLGNSHQGTAELRNNYYQDPVVLKYAARLTAMATEAFVGFPGIILEVANEGQRRFAGYQAWEDAQIAIIRDIDPDRLIMPADLPGHQELVSRNIPGVGTDDLDQLYSGLVGHPGCCLADNDHKAVRFDLLAVLKAACTEIVAGASPLLMQWAERFDQRMADELVALGTVAKLLDGVDMATLEPLPESTGPMWSRGSDSVRVSFAPDPVSVFVGGAVSSRVLDLGTMEESTVPGEDLGQLGPALILSDLRPPEPPDTSVPVPSDHVAVIDGYEVIVTWQRDETVEGWVIKMARPDGSPTSSVSFGFGNPADSSVGLAILAGEGNHTWVKLWASTGATWAVRIRRPEDGAVWKHGSDDEMNQGTWHLDQTAFLSP